ncbi:GntR family transcriptional regulator [Amycolatopsis sp. YIM 10]|uniref:GntR family transcriptional regulator n=1 Tax=Amycolatopsis sp. YIM 10 TaxID=2653857 RepID=UPI00351A5358
MSNLKPVRRVLLRDEAYELLRRAIITGDLAPGQQLREHDLAAELGLSRAPVRQALTRLTTEGLVESKPQSFTRVAPLESDDVRDALGLTRALHEFAVRTARLKPGDLDRMRAANARFAAAIEARDVDAAIEADDEFHDVPVEACGNRAVAETLDRYTSLLRRLERARFASLPAHRSVRRHEQLIDALAAGETGEAIRITGRIWAELGDLMAAGEET